MADTINSRIKKIRKSKGITQVEMAKILGMKHDTYSKLERNGNISCELLLKLSVLFKTDVTQFLYDDYENETINSPFIIARDIYEKLVVIAMRNLPSESKKEVYDIIVEKFVNAKGLINGVLSDIK